MQKMNTVFAYLFLFAAFVYGLWCAIFPEKIVEFRRRRGAFTDLVTGGYFYATKQRARATGGILALLSAIFIFLAIMQS